MAATGLTIFFTAHYHAHFHQPCPFPVMTTRKSGDLFMVLPFPVSGTCNGALSASQVREGKKRERGKRKESYRSGHRAELTKGTERSKMQSGGMKRTRMRSSYPSQSNIFLQSLCISNSFSLGRRGKQPIFVN